MTVVVGCATCWATTGLSLVFCPEMISAAAVPPPATRSAAMMSAIAVSGFWRRCGCGEYTGGYDGSHGAGVPSGLVYAPDAIGGGAAGGKPPGGVTGSTTGAAGIDRPVPSSIAERAAAAKVEQLG